MKNKQNLFRRLLAVMMLVLVMAFSTQTTAKAGFGDFNDYDSSTIWLLKKHMSVLIQEI